MTPHTDWEKKYFEANLLDGEDIHDCGGAMLRASEVWTVVEELLSHAVAERTEEIRESLEKMNYQNLLEGIEKMGKKPSNTGPISQARLDGFQVARRFIDGILSSLTPPITEEKENL